MPKKSPRKSGRNAPETPPPKTSEPDLLNQTDQQIVTRGLELAREFYQAHGYQAPEGYKFYESPHPQERAMWDLAVIAFEFLEHTDLDDALTNFLDDLDRAAPAEDQP